MVSVDQLLEEMDAMLESSMIMPFSGGKAMIDVEKMREMINDIRQNMPKEINDAKSVVSGRNDIIAAARKEAESIIRVAEERAKQLTGEQEILRRANIFANETTIQAQAKAREIRRGALEYAEDTMTRAEEMITVQLEQLRRAKQELHNSMRQDGVIQNGNQGQAGVPGDMQRRRRPDMPYGEQ